MALPKEVAERLNDAIPQALQLCVSEHDPARIITRSVVIFESLTVDGERAMTVFPGPDMRVWDILGMTTYVENFARMYMEQDGLQS